MNPSVYITIDVECSMGGAWGSPDLKPVPPSRAVWGEYADKRLGLSLIADIMEGHGLRGTFFVDAFMAEQGYPGQAEPICTFLLNRGHDVQLHIHPNHKHYALKLRGEAFSFTDQMADLEPKAQLALLVEGADRIEGWTGRRPAAFRAGNMGASEETLKQLDTAGIRIDSSYTFPYVGAQCRFRAQDPYNGSKWHGEVLELAVSGFRQPHLPGLWPAKPLNLTGISFEECRNAIGRICGAGADAAMILHSFSLFKVRNVQYDGGRPDRVVTRRFRRLCHWLGSHVEEFPTGTFTELARAIADGRYEAKAVPPCKLSGTRAVIRKAVQVYNNLYWT